jgi:cysteine desulfurase family protein (TIGR01976 family)
MKPFNASDVRQLFPALKQDAVFFDGPGGTQLPKPVIDAISGYMSGGTSNLIKSDFFTVQNTRRITKEAREKGAAFFNAATPSEIIFGGNMSSLTCHLSRSISREWDAGDEIIVTELDHYSNVSYWKQAAEDRGVKWHAVRVKPEDCTLDYDHLQGLINKKTKFIAFTLASNACGSLTDAARIVKMAKAVGAMTYADAVHYAPHFLPDVRALDCDFMASSPYKFYGPHLGMIYGKLEHLNTLNPYKVEPASDAAPERWETGTPNFEAQAGFCAQIDYLASLGEGKTLREKLQSSYARVGAYEQSWSTKFLERVRDIKGLKVWGIADTSRVKERTSTFAISLEGHSPTELSSHLEKHNIVSGPGSFYGIGVTNAVGLKDGAVRIGCVHYNTFDEMDRLFKALAQLV